MAFDLDLNAIQSAAKKRTANPWLMANAANLANEKQPEKPEKPEKLARLARLARLAISQTPTNAEKTPRAFDPGWPWLLSAANQLCDATNASARERADWIADLTAALPEHRADLLALVQGFMPKATPPAVVAPMTTATLPPSTSTWLAVRNAYYSHHHTCPVCIAAGKGYGLRCGAGAGLWAAYSAARFQVAPPPGTIGR